MFDSLAMNQTFVKNSRKLECNKPSERFVATLNSRLEIGRGGPAKKKNDTIHYLFIVSAESVYQEPIVPAVVRV